MNEITEKTIIGDVVGEHPSSAKIFEGYHIDFCCNGDISIGEACSSKNIEAGELIKKLEDNTKNPAGEDRNWKLVESLIELIEHIKKTFHAPLKEDLPFLNGLMEKVAARHGNSHPELNQMKPVYQSLKAELDMHLQKEENILYPIMQQIDEAYQSKSPLSGFHCGSVANPINQMENEHRSAGGALEELRRLSVDYSLPDGACNSYRALYDGLERFEAELHKHIHLENFILHPLARRMEQELGS